MPTSSQSLILMKSDTGSVTNFYKHKVQSEVVPFPIPRVNVTGDLSSICPHGNKVGDSIDRSGQDCYSVNGYRGVFSFDHLLKSFKWQLLPDPVESNKISENKNTEDSSDVINGPLELVLDEAALRHIEALDPKDKEALEQNVKDVLKRCDISDLQNINNRERNFNIESYLKLLNMGFSINSFEGLDHEGLSRDRLSDRRSTGSLIPFSTRRGRRADSLSPLKTTEGRSTVSLTPLKTEGRSTGSLNPFKAIHHITKKAASVSTIVIPAIGDVSSISGNKSVPGTEIPHKKISSQTSSSWWTQPAKSCEAFGIYSGLKRKNKISQSIQTALQNTSSTSCSLQPRVPRLDEVPKSLMTKQGTWLPDASVPKPRLRRRVRLRDFFPHNFDIVSVLSDIYLKKSRFTRNPRLRRQDVRLAQELKDLEAPVPVDGPEVQAPVPVEGPEVQAPEEEKKKPEKKKILKLPTIRMRKELPPSIPGALCFTLKKVSASHQDVKEVIEHQLGVSIDTLLFDPVYIHMGETDTEHKTMWVFTVAQGDSVQEMLFRQGITWDGERSRVRYYDDVMRDEHNAYKLYKTIQDEKKAKGLGSLRKKVSANL